ncbi:propionyl-CoA carboxylase, beta subunit domain protein [Mycobacterium kansasii]|uniref:Propionyl-CoA carboxylase, beta subunit domain protein n=1 Tax=Mycobacterium kansasii TaxID=1768 RepID=A0A1V3XJN9_MYCKA|nr:propionyl-CoA carboxylase, beta subunit domain protein [Mycobacterium kansasii]
MTVLQSTLDPNADAYAEAAAATAAKLDEIAAELAKALAGGGPNTSTVITPAANSRPGNASNCSSTRTRRSSS